MKKIAEKEGNRTKTGYHTGYAILKSSNGKYYVSQESGTRPATKKEIESLKSQTE